MSRSVRHTLIVKDTNHCGSNKQDKRLANHKVRKFKKPHIDDVRELWKLDNVESIDEDQLDFLGEDFIMKEDAYYCFISAKVDSIASNKGYKKIFESWNISDYKFRLEKGHKHNFKYMK